MATTVIWPFTIAALPILYRFSIKVACCCSWITFLTNEDTYSDIDQCVGEENTCYLKLTNLNKKIIVTTSLNVLLAATT